MLDPRGPAIKRNNFRHARRVLRTWLYPTKGLQTLSGWVSLMWGIFVSLAPVAVSRVVATQLGYLKSGLWTATALLLGLLLLALVALWKTVPREEVSAEFVPDGHNGFRVVVRKGGKSLPQAAIYLVVPECFESIYSGTTDDFRSGTKVDDVIVWEEKNLPIMGGGRHPTEWRFRSTIPPGDHELVLTVTDDLLGSVEIKGTLSMETTEAWENQAALRRNGHLNAANLALNILVTYRELLSSALRGTRWEPSNEANKLRGQSHHFRETDVLSSEDAAAVTQAISSASEVYAHYNRKRAAIESGIRDDQIRRQHEAREKGEVVHRVTPQEIVLETDADDGVPKTLVEVLYAIQRVENALERATT
jgi:hypothetical protein